MWAPNRVRACLMSLLLLLYNSFGLYNEYVNLNTSSVSSPSYRFVLWSFVDDPWRSSLRRSLSFVWRNSLCVYWCLFVTHSRRSFSFALSLSFRFDLLFVIIIVYFQSLSIRLNINCQVGLPYLSKSSGLIFGTERSFSMTTLLWKILFKGRQYQRIRSLGVYYSMLILI